MGFKKFFVFVAVFAKPKSNTNHAEDM